MLTMNIRCYEEFMLTMNIRLFCGDGKLNVLLYISRGTNSSFPIEFHKVVGILV